MKTLSSGGLGDAVIAYAKIMSENSNVSHTHVMVKETLYNAVRDFFLSQEIDIEVKIINNWINWKSNNGKNFDKYYDVYVKNLTNPFPKFTINKEYDYDVVISPSSGRNNERFFNINEIKNLIKKYNNLKFVLIGTEKNPKKYDDIGADNLINKTTIGESIDILSSSKYVVSPSGFVSIISCMLNKNVFTKETRLNIRRIYYHSEWKNKFINKLNEIELC